MNRRDEERLRRAAKKKAASRGRGGRRAETEPPADAAEIEPWFRGRLRDDWFEDVELRIDRDEILVIGTVPTPALAGDDADAAGAAAAARIDGFREQTRDDRVALASEAEFRFQRKVSWAVRCGDAHKAFTVANVPVMTRLLMDERAVLDTLIAAGVARSRSEALAWCVKLVGTKQAEWIDELRDALVAVEKVRAEGPSLD